MKAHARELPQATDKIINFYDKLNIKGNKLPKNWNKHHIMHNSMILAIGGTGTGKTNALLNYINRSIGEFHKIIVFSASTTDEPLYNLLEENGVTLYNDIDELPELSEFEDDKEHRRCFGGVHLFMILIFNKIERKLCYEITYILRGIISIKILSIAEIEKFFCGKENTSVSSILATVGGLDKEEIL